MAKLYYRYGAMNSGKTTALLQVAFNYNERGMRVLILKASVDTKGGDHIVSRLGVSHKVDVLVSPDMDILDIVRADTAAHGSAPACVLCDESQFFTPAQAEQLFLVTVDLNIPVICYGLRADFHEPRFSRFHPPSGAGPYHRGDENHLRLRPQSHLQRPQGKRRVRV